MEVIIRQKAVALGYTRYFTSKACKHGHISQRRTRDGCCVECLNVGARTWRVNNPNYYKSSQHVEYSKRWREDHPTYMTTYMKQWYETRKDDPVFKQQNSEHMKQWAKDNPGKHAARIRLYKTCREEAQPTWVLQEDIDIFYDQARLLSRQTGIMHTVDHIVPLVHDKVCGLHVPANLQVLSKSENSSKNNRFDVDGDAIP